MQRPRKERFETHPYNAEELDRLFHLVVWLSKGGADSVDNTVALYPNCHKKMHVVNDPTDVRVLLRVAKSNAE